MNPATPLGRYRVLAYVVGVGLILLVCVAVPLKYLAGSPGMAQYVGMAHGFLYMAYILSTLDLAFRRRWPLTRVVVVAVAGTVPFMSFVAERWVSRLAAEQDAANAAGGTAGVATATA